MLQADSDEVWCPAPKLCCARFARGDGLVIVCGESDSWLLCELMTPHNIMTRLPSVIVAAQGDGERGTSDHSGKGEGGQESGTGERSGPKDEEGDDEGEDAKEKMHQRVDDITTFCPGVLGAPRAVTLYITTRTRIRTPWWELLVGRMETLLGKDMPAPFIFMDVLLSAFSEVRQVVRGTGRYGFMVDVWAYVVQCLLNVVDESAIVQWIAQMDLLGTMYASGGQAQGSLSLTFGGRRHVQWKEKERLESAATCISSAQLLPVDLNSLFEEVWERVEGAEEGDYGPLCIVAMVSCWLHWMEVRARVLSFPVEWFVEEIGIDIKSGSFEVLISQNKKRITNALFRIFPELEQAHWMQQVDAANASGRSAIAVKTCSFCAAAETTSLLTPFCLPVRLAAVCTALGVAVPKHFGAICANYPTVWWQGGHPVCDDRLVYKAFSSRGNTNLRRMCDVVLFKFRDMLTESSILPIFRTCCVDIMGPLSAPFP